MFPREQGEAGSGSGGVVSSITADIYIPHWKYEPGMWWNMNKAYVMCMWEYEQVVIYAISM